MPLRPIAEALHQADPGYPKPSAELDGRFIELPMQSEAFGRFNFAVEQASRAVTHAPQEAFFTYLKVSIITGVILSSPWTFYQIWAFVAAGLYPHERAWVKRYGWLSLLLFIGGALFCFHLVLPFALRFFIGFNEMLEVSPQIQLTEWISLATTVPLLFGVSFQLPIVMLFLERIGVFSREDYREKRKLAAFVIAVISMMLTPSDPTTMLMMMAPLMLLYELGIKLTEWTPPATPFDDAIEVESR